MKPESSGDVHRPVRWLNPTLLALLGGIIILILLVAYFATDRSPNQDRLNDSQLAQTRSASFEKLCSSEATYEQMKSELFARAAQLRTRDEAAYERISKDTLVRVEDPAMESEDSSSVHCSGSLWLDLPAGIATADGRRILMSDVDYTVEPAANGNPMTVTLGNSDAILMPLVGLVRTSAPPAPGAPPEANQATGEAVDLNQAAPQQSQQHGEAKPAPANNAVRPSFDCSAARSSGEMAICSDPAIAALDRATAAQFARALAIASPDQQVLLRDSERRFSAYRERCPTSACLADAYSGRMREIRDIMEGRFQPR